MIAVIDYDIGNISAVCNMIKYVGGNPRIVKNAADLEDASGIILPGNGSFDACIRNLRDTGLLPALERRVLLDKTPILGICVGAQMLGRSSEEGVEKGLGWLDMQVRRFPTAIQLPLPHMGWNRVSRGPGLHPLFAEIDDEEQFYFLHSFYMDALQKDDVLLETTYGVRFASAVGRENIIGVQFHPEKSHRFGKRLISKFLEWK